MKFADIKILAVLDIPYRPLPFMPENMALHTAADKQGTFNLRNNLYLRDKV